MNELKANERPRGRDRDDDDDATVLETSRAAKRMEKKLTDRNACETGRGTRFGIRCRERPRYVKSSTRGSRTRIEETCSSIESNALLIDDCDDETTRRRRILTVKPPFLSRIS